MEDASSRGRTEAWKVHLLGSCRKRQRQNKLNYCVCVDQFAYLNTAEQAGKEGTLTGWSPPNGAVRGREAEGRRGAGLAGPGRAGPGRAGGGERGGLSPGAVNFSWAAACQPQKALKVQQPAPASAAAFVRVIYDFNLGSPRVHTAFAAVEG